MGRPVARLRASIQADIAQFDTNLKRATSSLSSAQGAMQRDLAKIDRQFDSTRASMEKVASVAGTVRNALGTIGVGLGIREVVSAVVEAGLKLDRLNTQLKFVTGSATGAAREYEYLRKVTNDLGLEFDSTAVAYAKFAAAAKGTAIEGQGTRDVFEAVAKSATVMQLSADDTSAIFLALSQALAKGKLSSEEFRQQMGERLPIALGVAARALGVTEAEFTELLESGEVITAEFLPKFAAQMEKEVGGAAVDAAAAASAEINRLKNAWGELLGAMSSSELTGIMARGLARFTQDATDAWQALERLTMGVDTSNISAVTAEIERLYETKAELDRQIAGGGIGGMAARELDDVKDRLAQLVEIRARLLSDSFTPPGTSSGGGLPVEEDKSALRAAEQVEERLARLRFELAQLGRTEIDQQVAASLQGIKPTPEQAAEIEHLTRQIETFKMVAEASKEDIDGAVAAMNAGIKDFDSQSQEIAAIYEATRTPAEAYAIEVERLNNLLGGSAEKQDLLNRALADAKTEFDKATEGSTEFRDIARDAAGELFTGFADAVIEAENLNDALGELIKTMAKLVINKAIGAGLDGLFNWAFPAKASGGPGGGMTLVGERGPELVNLPAGSYVNPASRSSGMMRQMVGGGNIAAPGGVVMNNTFNIAPGGSREQNMDLAEQMSTQLERIARKITREEIGNQQRVGGLLNSRAAGYGGI